VTGSAGRLDDALLLDLCARHVLRPGEHPAHVTRWPGREGLLLRTTAARAFLVLPSADLRLRSAPWVAEVVVAEPLDGCTGGASERGFAVFTDGRSMSLNDPGAVAFLAGALHHGLDPLAYAEILLRWHPWTAADRGLVLHPGELRRQAARPDLPDLALPVLQAHRTGRRLHFASWSRHAQVPGGRPRVDAFAWTVDVPYEGRTRWTRSVVLAGVRVGDPAPAQAGGVSATSR